jgi:hypothetical protein
MLNSRYRSVENQHWLLTKLNPHELITMFAIFRSKKADVLSHWYTLVPGFNTSTQEFYGSVEEELKARQLPGLEMSRVDFSEGGILSDKRTYLRMSRERLVFDVCAAPFGTSYFFSCRFAELPLAVKLSELIFLVLAGALLVGLSWYFLGFWTGSVALIAILCTLAYVLRNAVAMGLGDLDAFLLKCPLGSTYQLWFRKETYYRQDTRLMYHDSVNDIVKAKVETVTCAKGVKLLNFSECDPILGELYKKTTVQFPKPTA